MLFNGSDAWPLAITAQLKLQAVRLRTAPCALTSRAAEMRIAAVWHRSDGYRSNERVQRLDLRCADHMSEGRRPKRPRASWASKADRRRTCRCSKDRTWSVDICKPGRGLSTHEQ